jgi:hypothetical protein
MAAGVYVEVPEELADLLEDDDFVVAGSPRGAGADALIAVSAAGAGASVATILLVRHDIHRFIGHLWNWTRTRGDGVEVTFAQTVGELSVTYRMKNLPPEIAVDLITTSLAPLLEGRLDAGG